MEGEPTRQLTNQHQGLQAEGDQGGEVGSVTEEEGGDAGQGEQGGEEGGQQPPLHTYLAQTLLVQKPAAQKMFKAFKYFMTIAYSVRDKRMRMMENERTRMARQERRSSASRSCSFPPTCT